MNSNLERAKDLLTDFAQNLTNKGIPSAANEGYVALVNKIPLIDVSVQKPHQQRFIDIDGSVFYVQNYATGENGAYPVSNPTKAGLTFVGYTYSLEELVDCQYRTTERSILRIPGDIDVGIQWKTENDVSVFEFDFVDNTDCELLFSRTKDNSPVTLIIQRDDDEALSNVTLPEYPQTVSVAGNWNTTGKHKITITSMDNAHYQLGNASTFILQGAKYLTKAYLADIVTIGQNNFRGCSSLEEILIPQTVTEIPDYFCAQTALSSVVIPKNVTIIGQGAFYGNSKLKFVALSNSISELKDGCFFSGREDFEGIATINMNFCCSNIDKIVLPKGFTNIPKFAFTHCGIKSLISDPLTTIGDYAFMQATNLRKINLATTITAGMQSFIGNSAIEEIDNLFINWEEVDENIPNDSVINFGNWGVLRLNPNIPPVSEDITEEVELNINVLGARCDHLILGAEISSIADSVKISNSSVEAYIFEYQGIVNFNPQNLFANEFNFAKARVYVPDGQVLNYQEQQNWQQFANYVMPISKLPVEMKQYLYGITQNEVYNV